MTRIGAAARCVPGRMKMAARPAVSGWAAEFYVIGGGIFRRNRFSEPPVADGEFDRGDVGSSVEGERNVQLLSERRNQLVEAILQRWECTGTEVGALEFSSPPLEFCP